MSSSQSSSTTSTQQPGRSVVSNAQAGTAPQKTVLVSGEQGDSVNVQSQLATSSVAGDVSSKSNISQVMNDLGSRHDNSGAWLDAENSKISQWGNGEIQRVLSQTKAMEEALVAGAKEKQKALDAKHSAELAKLVQEMDLRKAAELKELEDGLQRQIQASLTASKQDINRVESEMNAKKMELLKQSQLKSAKEIDSLSNLVVETKLVPSQTRTVIETDTHTGNVVAVATGGNISTGSAQGESYSSQKIAAIPNAGELRQASDVTVGDMIQDSTGRKVGEGAIVNTQTNVREQQNLQAGARGGDVTVNARPLTADQQQQQQQPIAHREQPAAPVAHGAGAGAGGVQHDATKDRVIHDAASHGTKGLHHVAAPADGLSQGVKQAYLAEHQGQAGQHKEAPMAHDAAALHGNKDAEPHQHGLICKMKHALGIDGKSSHEHHAAGEPRSSDATRRV